MSRRSARWVAVAVVSCLGLLTGCVGMPTSGPVVEQEAATDVEELSGAYFDPRPPLPGQTPGEIVNGFMEAMKATPIRTSVAKQFLAANAKDAWAPEDRILTYAGVGAPVGRSRITLNLTDVNRYDSRGAWRRTTPSGTLRFSLVEEEGEWRISEAPNALIVPDSWFADWYDRVSLYYFDPTAQILVPEPVFAPKGDQFASSLVRGLLAPPQGGDSAQVVSTAFPQSLEPGLSVPITAAGVAQVTLNGDPSVIDTDTAQRMLAQLAWTLRQDPNVRAIEVTIGGRALGGTGGLTQIHLDVGDAYDPTLSDSSPDLFALDGGLLVRGTITTLIETQGPFGRERFGLRSVAVSLDGSRAAGISRDRTTLWLAPVDQAGGQATQVPLDSTDLMGASWDFRDRLWVLGSGPEGARVSVVDGPRVRQVRVPGLTGARVSRLQVSNDGSRLAAIVRRNGRDRVVVARMRYDGRGRLLGVTRARPLDMEETSSQRVSDLVWRSPTSISVLQGLSGDLFRVLTLSVDGAPAAIPPESSSRLISGRIRALVSSPRPGRPAMALSREAVTNLSTPENSYPGLPARVSYLTYVG